MCGWVVFTCIFTHTAYRHAYVCVSNAVQSHYQTILRGIHRPLGDFSGEHLSTCVDVASLTPLLISQGKSLAAHQPPCPLSR